MVSGAVRWGALVLTVCVVSLGPARQASTFGRGHGDGTYFRANYDKTGHRHSGPAGHRHGPRHRHRGYFSGGYFYGGPFYGFGYGYGYPYAFSYRPYLYGPFYGTIYRWSVPAGSSSVWPTFPTTDDDAVAKDRAPGFFEADIRPTAAELFVNGVFVGTAADLADATGRPARLMPGRYRILVRAPGYRDREFRVTISPQETTRLVYEMSPD